VLPFAPSHDANLWHTCIPSKVSRYSRYVSRYDRYSQCQRARPLQLNFAVLQYGTESHFPTTDEANIISTICFDVLGDASC
jgi:hypothetical protein